MKFLYYLYNGFVLQQRSIIYIIVTTIYPSLQIIASHRLSYSPPPQPQSRTHKSLTQHPRMTLKSRLPTPAQAATIPSNDLTSDISLQAFPPPQTPLTCACQNPFCDAHYREDDDLTLEWASPPKPKPHALTTFNPTTHPQKRQKLTVLEKKWPRTVIISGVIQNSTLLRKRYSQQRQKLTVLEKKCAKTVVICATPQKSKLWRKRRA